MDRPTDRQGDSYIYPLKMIFAGGIKTLIKWRNNTYLWDFILHVLRQPQLSHGSESDSKISVSVNLFSAW